jgi:hypothetical protein
MRFRQASSCLPQTAEAVFVSQKEHIYDNRYSPSPFQTV